MALNSKEMKTGKNTILSVQKYRFRKKTVFFPVIIFTILFSCEMVVDVDIPIEKPALVVNAVLQHDFLPEVRVTYSKHILDNAHGFRAVEGAEVFIRKDEEDWIRMERDNEDTASYRTGQMILQEAHTYEIKVEKEGYEQAFGSVKIPGRVPVKAFTYHGTKGEFSWNKESDVDIFFDDPPGTNYYELSGFVDFLIHTEIENGDTTFVYSREILHFSPKNPAYDTEYNYWGKILFNDRLFEGKEANIGLLVRGGYFDEDFTGKVYIVLQNVSESYYLFHSALQLQGYSGDDPFAQPVQVYTNVQNGLGAVIGGAYEQLRIR